MKDKPWFKQKTYGLGATPITWQGWATTFAFIGLILWRGTILARDNNASSYLIEFVFMLTVFIFFVAYKTEGGFKWRWGKN
ncbi:hypothetical protein GOV04_00075 [Candidatus Woesearchaeota archaeon]|nr:hypothetical protein [Candidatus Woesearchaeota archaeon]